MALTTVQVSLTSFFQNYTPFAGIFRMRLKTPAVGDDILVFPKEDQEVSFDTGGDAVLSVIPNALLSPQSYYRFHIVTSDTPSRLVFAGDCVVPETDCQLLDIITVGLKPESVSSAEAFASQAKQAALQAEYSANEASAAASSASSSATSASNTLEEVTQVATAALSDIRTAKDAATSAISTAQTTAVNAVTSAQNTATSAVTSAQQAAVDAVEAKGAEQKALLDTQVGEAKSHADAAALSAENASTSASEAAASAASISGLVPQINANTAGVAQNAVSALVNQKRISNLEALLAGEVYTEAKDSTVAYAKIVGDESITGGAEVMPYAGVETIGGKTLAWNQKIESLITSYPPQMATLEVSERQFVVTITTDASSRSTGPYWFPGLTQGHTALAKAKVKADIDCTVRCGSDNAPAFSVSAGEDFIDIAAISVLVNNATSWFTQHDAGCAGQTVTFKDVQLFDLTLMFGAGNEPATVEEFEAMFPADYYPYDPGTLKSAAVTEVVSSDSESVTLGSLSIPAAVQALEGYGWSAGTAKNWIDWENKVYHREVGAFTDMGALGWGSRSDGEVTSFFEYTTSTVKAGGSCICPAMATVTSSNVWYGTAQGISIHDSSSRFWVYAPSYTTTPEFKAAMSGVPLYYELATPELIDISDLLTDDNLIPVQEGGVITFPNHLGDDYSIPVPSDVTYTLKLSTEEEATA